MHMPNIKSKEDVVHYVNEVGYLPFFRNHISGFSLEDMVELTYIGVTEFRYKVAKKTGQPYGWGVAVLDTAEHCWGEELCRGAYHRTPEKSLERILEKLSHSLPDCKEADIMKLIKA